MSTCLWGNTSLDWYIAVDDDFKESLVKVKITLMQI